ncbi:FERM domain-containing protein 4A-like isoform X2 [Saccostrea cucullata]|uniref:FERM domain-containing protein 4A-like isoform X2 n=1 Tax=Saccostrea cuccullata TaxID=36930 RepID=UPI002ED276EB
MSTKSRKKVGFAEDVKSEERESRSRGRTKFRERRSKSQDVKSNRSSSLSKKRDHSLISLVRTGSRASVRSLVKLFENVGGMNEGRKSQIVLPDERRLDLLIQPKLTSRDLLDLVASHFKLKEKEYFGLCYQDDTGHQNWLNLEKRVLEHEFVRRAGTLVLIFAVRFYVESIASLRDIQTVEVFFLNAKQAIFKGQIECDSETIFELAAYVLQVTHGDYTSDENARHDLKKLPVIPTYILREHPSIQYCEDRVISYYQKIAGSTRGLAIVNYLSIVESLPTYGTHYYEVKDKKDHPWWLGLSYKGIAVYDKTDKTTPRKVFNWKQLENLYYRDKKFSIEVHDTKRVVHTLSSFNLYEDAILEPPEEFDELSDAITDPTTQVSVSRRTFGPGNVIVHSWFGSTPQLTKCIWCMAVAQHQFYLDRKHNKSSLSQARSVSEIAAELSRSTSSLQGSLGSDSISRSGSSASLPSLSASRFDLNCDPSIEAVKAQREMYTALKARKEALEEAVSKKLEELKQLCIQEGELTGCLPLDYPQQPGEPLPTIRKRVGTAFSLASKVPERKTDDALSTLELEYELQKQITNAAKKLSSDKSVSKYVRKQRRQSFHKAQAKLKEMEKKLSETKGDPSHFLPSGAPSYDGSNSRLQDTTSPELPPRRRADRSSGDGPRQITIQRSATTRELSPTSPPPLSPTLSSPQLNSLSQANTYRNQIFPPPLSSRSASSGSNMSSQSEYENVKRYEKGSQDSGFSSNNNMYNLNTQRTSHYESTDEIKTPTNPDFSDNVLTGYGKSDMSLKYDDYRKPMSQGHYGSLERNTRRRDRWSYRDRQLSDGESSVLTDLEPSKFGSKRNSQSEYDLVSSRNSVIEVPVKHEETGTPKHQRHKSAPWEDSAFTEPSPIITSPDQHENSFENHCYSPRLHEGSFFGSKGPSSLSDQSFYPGSRSDSPQYTKKSNAVVTVTKIQPHRNVEVISKPFEMSDFYKYSEKMRRQRYIEQYQQQLIGGSRCSSPSQQSTDSGGENSFSGSNSSFAHPVSSSLHTSPSHSLSSVSCRPGPGSPATRRGSPFLSHKRENDQSFESPQHGSPRFEAVKEHSSHVQYSMQTPTGTRVYKSVQTKHTHYQPLTPQKCDPLTRNQASTPRTHHRHHKTQMERSGGLKSYSPIRGNPQDRKSPNVSMDASFAFSKDSVADDFGEEMMAWIDKEGTNQNPSFV